MAHSRLLQLLDFKKQMHAIVKKATFGAYDCSLGDSLGMDPVACIENWYFLLPAGSL